MAQKCKDETRWLVRILAVYIVIFVSNGFVNNVVAAFNGLRGDASGLMSAVIGLILDSVFFWLGFRLLVCRSLWDFLSFLEKYPLYTFMQYVSINRHIRSGLTGFAVLLLVVWPVPLMRWVFEDTIIAEWFGYIFTMVLWPLRTMCRTFDAPPPRAVVFLIVLVYILITGFVLGAGVSYLSGRITRNETVTDKPWRA